MLAALLQFGDRHQMAPSGLQLAQPPARRISAGLQKRVVWLRPAGL